MIRILGGIIIILGIGLLVNHHPFQSSRFDSYHGDQGIKPYQELINYVNKRNGHVLWLHPESNYAVNRTQMGPVKLMTKHYPDDLIAARGYTGFEAIYGDNITATDPGKQWDRVLRAYCRGDREQPVWGVSGADFYGTKGAKIDEFQTIFLILHKTSKAVLDALDKGRFYAVRKGKGPRLSLDRFQVKDDETGVSVISGQELDLEGFPLLDISLSASDNGRHPIKVSLIRGVEIMESFEGKTPLEIHFVDKEYQAGKTYYRLEVRGAKGGKLLSNPIFVMKK